MKSQNNIKQKIHENLFNGEITDFNNVLLEQYKLYIGSANQTSSARSQTNTFFVSINTIIIGFVTAILTFSQNMKIVYWMIFACLIGLCTSITWFITIRSYRTLNSARFIVIQQLETRMSANIYNVEWKILLKDRPNRNYQRLTQIEQFVPIFFGILYVVLIITILLP
jgi:hypothetical protein